MSVAILRCSNKRRFADQATTEAFIKRFVLAGGRRGIPRRKAYKCPHCAWWHITSKF